MYIILHSHWLLVEGKDGEVDWALGWDNREVDCWDVSDKKTFHGKKE